MLLNVFIGAILKRCLFGFRQLLAYQFKPLCNENAQHTRFTDVPLSFLLAAICVSSVSSPSVTLSLSLQEKDTLIKL